MNDDTASLDRRPTDSDVDQIVSVVRNPASYRRVATQRIIATTSARGRRRRDGSR